MVNSTATHNAIEIDYAQLKIQSFQHWEIYLHENQCYIGRVFLLLKNDSGLEDFLALEGEARDEFFTVGNAVKVALKQLFLPDKMNYAALSNLSPRIHIHLIPRYKEARNFGGMTFMDQRWGQNYAPDDHQFVFEQAMLFKIRDALSEQLEL